MSRVYLDHAATTDILPAALQTMVEQMRAGGNPSSLHSAGRDARATVEYARERIARAIGCDAAEVIFTSGGTEADNQAIKGMYFKRRAADPARTRLIVSSIEHHAVEETAEWLHKEQGAQLDWIPVDNTGTVNPETVRELIERNPADVALVTVMWANNEVGTIQPVAQIAAIAAEYGIPVHTDAVQAFGAVPINFRKSGVTTMAISAHKIGGPMGVGALIATRSADMTPVLHGGGQERAVRSGTIDAPAIAGFGEAAEHVIAHLEEESRRIAALRNELVAAVQATIPQAHLSGPNPLDEEYPGQKRLPSNAHFTFENAEGDTLLFLLDMQGIATSTGSACNAGVTRPSHVLIAMGMDEDTARSAQRFTLGHSSTAEDIATLLAALPGAYTQAAKAGLSSQLPDASRWYG
ncbi:MAG: cysteine desulfurase family protein [Rothia sp. (in: high G+C Gram-positive bacteria)]|uniref:cysteine desulfurase family protein n=1 Tax=Rothia sp. (in: high G+C Gram-positive bacteria) TaxID=1885016 RepID=UPI0026E03E1F|nr:cysteine desulfurase family protein [Rothia sp. (in: high G+C Gram-positive bacteria)]MDO5750108.1 cysteine desulfurase family protein [Rothia sp. (in: high G+C Gram-positive bacteria)]